MIKIAGVILIALGLLALVYHEFTYTRTKQDAQIGSLTIQHQQKETVPISPLVGVVFIGSGIAVLFIGNKRSL